MSTGAALITAERERQIMQEGYTDGHDNEFTGGELVAAAICYAVAPEVRAAYMVSEEGRDRVNLPGGGYHPDGWPDRWDWSPVPHDRVRELTKAGALIAAEIDRLLRAA